MIRLNDIIDKVSVYNPAADLDLIRKAYVFSAKVHQGQNRLSGEPYLIHPMEVAAILADLKLDVSTVVTGLLHDTVEDTLTTLIELERVFGPEVANLVDGVTKIGKINFKTKEESQAENFRKMLLAMSDDIRVILIKLADRLHNMRTLQYQPEPKQRSIARETLDIYAPIANRLGISWIRSELEDLSFRYMDPQLYYDLASKVTKKKQERETDVAQVKEVIQQKLAEHGIKGEVSGRSKHLYSIYRKMESRSVDIDQIYDLIAIRILVEDIRECYEVLGIIHSTWKPVPGRFKDYIAMPKGNMYQSLHTTVIGPFAERMEIQIRTLEMHRVAEAGIAAHWKYKEGKGYDEKEVKRFAWLRQLLEWQQELQDSREFMDTVKLELFPEDVYVFTPKGDVKSFPKGATPIDFAYSVHTDVGHRCVGAKVNSKLVPLKYELKNGDIIEIITSPHHTPSKDWLKIVKSYRARNKIRAWIKTEERKRSISLGRETGRGILRKQCGAFRPGSQRTVSMKKLTSTQETLRAAMLSRRSLLKASAALGAVGFASPLYVKNAFSSSGELNLLMWSDEYPDPVIPNFEKASGIKINQTPFSQNEEQINKLQATGGEGFDLCSPTINRAPQYKDLNVLAPFDTNKLTNASNILPSMMDGAKKLWTWEDGLYYMPHCWGSEAISYRTDLYKGDPAQLSYGSLWDEGVKGHVQGRPHSYLLSIGLWWDGNGKMPTNRMLDGYKDEDSFKKVWDPILAFAIEHKAWVKQFWDSADNTKSGLMENDVWIGLTWDGPPLSLKKEGKPVNYTAPKEGAIAWVDGVSLMKSAKNVDQAYAFLNYLHTPEASAAVAEGSGYNPVVTGADALLSDVAKKNFQEAFPGDALKNLWPWPVEPAWYAEIRSQYADKFKAA